MSAKKPMRGGRPRLMESRLERITLTLDPETIQKLAEAAKARERSASFVAREALKRYFEQGAAA